MWQVTIGYSDGTQVSGRASRIECYRELGEEVVLIEWESGDPEHPRQEIYREGKVKGMYLALMEAK